MNTKIKSVDKHGNIRLDMTITDILNEYSFGDILSVSFNERSYNMPLCTSFSDVDSGKTVIRCFKEDGEEKVELAVNFDSFAEKYFNAARTVLDGEVVWTDFDVDMNIDISMSEKGGYYEEWKKRAIEYSYKREDYPDLTDEEYANFREVRSERIKSGLLYRSSSPVDPSICRNVYADNAIAKHDIKTILNIADNRENLNSFPCFDKTNYSERNHISFTFPMSPNDYRFKNLLAVELRYLIQNKGPYLIHCREGKDRTGFVVALLQGLCGEKINTVYEEYMQTYVNYYHLKKGDETYEIIRLSTAEKLFIDAYKEMINDDNIEILSKNYLIEAGLNITEIELLKDILSK